MKILVACEESSVVTTAFRDLGHAAFSCDLLPCSGASPDFHLQCDVREVLSDSWDMVLAFPPCTHLCVSGARWFSAKRQDFSQDAAIDFFMIFTKLSHVPRVAIENPVGIMSSVYRKPDQIVQPWWFGCGEVKRTCLWLKGLPPLVPTSLVSGRCPRIWRLPPSPSRSLLRSKTYQGVADAMASQWGNSFETDLLLWADSVQRSAL